MVVRRRVDDGLDADVQSAYAIDIYICARVDDILYGADIPKCNVDTCRGLRMFWRCIETFALADIL
jgi:hypothetical protein